MASVALHNLYSVIEASHLHDLKPASETPFKWCFAGGPILARHFQGIGGWFHTSYKVTYSFVNLQGNLDPFLDPHMKKNKNGCTLVMPVFSSRKAFCSCLPISRTCIEFVLQLSFNTILLRDNEPVPDTRKSTRTQNTIF